jgi:hypothetical protein
MLSEKYLEAAFGTSLALKTINLVLKTAIFGAL